MSVNRTVEPNSWASAPWVWTDPAGVNAELEVYFLLSDFSQGPNAPDDPMSEDSSSNIRTEECCEKSSADSHGESFKQQLTSEEQNFNVLIMLSHIKSSLAKSDYNQCNQITSSNGVITHILHSSRKLALLVFLIYIEVYRWIEELSSNTLLIICDKFTLWRITCGMGTATTGAKVTNVDPWYPLLWMLSWCTSKISRVKWLLHSVWCWLWVHLGSGSRASKGENKEKII